MTAAAGMLGAAMAAAIAGGGGGEIQELDALVVTGSRAAPRAAKESASPVDVYTGEDLAARGFSDLSRALQFLSPSFNYPRSATAPSAANTRAATLRGLAPDQVLVLIDGKRRHASSVINFNNVVGRGSTPVDFNLIPMSAIARIEVLRDGAAAQYGSDAIAGVINVVLRKESAGGEISAQAGATSQGDGETALLTARKGFAVGEEGAVTLSAEARRRRPTNRAAVDSRFGRVTSRQGDPDALDVNLAGNLSLPTAWGELYGNVLAGWRDSESYAQYRAPTIAPALYPAGFTPLIALDLFDIGLTAGVRGRIGGWDVDLSDTFGLDRADFTVSQSANTTLGAASPTSFDAGGTRYRQNLVNLAASRRFDVLAGLNLAGGLEHRHETYEIVSGEPASFTGAGAQGFPGFNPPSPVDESRTALSAYADAELSLTEALRVAAAGRFEHYDDFGDGGGGKLSVFYKPAHSLALRATASTGFRAPSLQQTFFSTVSSQQSGGLLVNVGTFAVDDPVSRALGARPLKPERSVNLSAGLIWTPAPGLAFTFDAYRIQIEDRIALSESLQGTAVSAILRAAGVTNASQVRFFTNALDSTTEGVDVTAEWRGELAGGRLRLTGAYGLATSRVDALKPNTVLPGLPLLGLASLDLLLKAQPRDRATVSAAWSRGAWHLSLDVNRFGSYRTVTVLSEQTFSPKVSVDLAVGYALNERVALRAGVLNLGDAYPDRTAERALTQGGGLQYGEAGGLGVDGREYFVRVTGRF